MTNARHILEPIVEDETLSESTSSMACETHSFAEVPTPYSMAFNVRLSFARLNDHEAQIYKDPMNRWVVKVEEHPYVRSSSMG